ncbi:hypothetical protein [Streptomyces virginiae]|uniref:hypothetical protein n=1 Tax=Streptomyces virginiae TaxID=1961 RepID=UPI0022564BD1|nr:hypothetical protein [Streptomyces virginiae]MCX5278149.1 hypothetical protein [Streptomyces virginiae]
MAEDPSPQFPQQTARNNTGPTVQVGGPNHSPINISYRLPLPCNPVPGSDRAAASEPLWAHTITPQRAADLLAATGLVIITGEHGSGRRISAVRALQTRLAGGSTGAHLFDLAPDWEDDETPTKDVLPQPRPGCGYLIDATSRRINSQAALALTSWAEQLHALGSCLAITGGPRDWQGDSRYAITAVRPDALQVARNHLAVRLGSPTQAHWLHPDPNQAPARSGLLRGPAAPDRTAGALADLIPRNVSPSNAVSIAERLSGINVDRFGRAVQQRDDKENPEAQKQGLKELRGIRDEVLLWTNFLEKTLTETGTRGQDRVMLLSAAYLEGAPLEVCIRAAAAFAQVPGEEPVARRFREGRSPRRRLRDVGVDATADDRADFSSRPGLALNAIRMDWHHWADEREQTRIWLARITAPGETAAAWVDQIGERLLELSRTEVDPPFFSMLEEWTATPEATARIETVARLLTQAAESDELARQTHKTLLDWASQKSNPHRRVVVAQVCRGTYGQQWPHTSLVRLRHLLGNDDPAAGIAASAMTAYAGSTAQAFAHVIDAVESWLERFPTHPAGPRAFLALADPANPHSTLTRLITAAQSSPKLRDFLITGWWATLEQPDVRERAHQVLLAWAQAIHEKRLDRTFTFGILTDVRNAHTPVDAMSRFLYGSPEHDDPALIDARYALANLRACSHTRCPQPDCPNTPASGTPTEVGAAGGGGEPLD